MAFSDRRLRAILDEVNARVFADIGCDHGYIAVGALVEGRAEKVYAADISEKSLAKAVALAREKGVFDRLVPVVSDGFERIPERVDSAVIAGLGGLEMIKILENAEKADKIPETLVLCPHQHAKELRAYLGAYRIDKDYIVRSGGKYYPVIVARRGGEGYSADEVMFGKNTPPGGDFIDMILSRRRTLEERFSAREMPPNVKREYEEILGICSKYKTRYPQ